MFCLSWLKHYQSREKEKIREMSFYVYVKVRVFLILQNASYPSPGLDALLDFFLLQPTDQAPRVSNYTGTWVDDTIHQKFLYIVNVTLTPELLRPPSGVRATRLRRPVPGHSCRHTPGGASCGYSRAWGGQTVPWSPQYWHSPPRPALIETKIASKHTEKKIASKHKLYLSHPRPALIYRQR